MQSDYYVCILCSVDLEKLVKKKKTLLNENDKNSYSKIAFAIRIKLNI